MNWEVCGVYDVPIHSKVFVRWHIPDHCSAQFRAGARNVDEWSGIQSNRNAANTQEKLNSVRSGAQHKRVIEVT